jgi:Caspase domain
MRTCLSIAAILLATIFLQHQAVGQISPRGDPLRQGYALLIGNSHYKDPRWPQLDEVPLQLNALRAGLANHFNSVEVVQNLETEALRQKIDQFLRVYGNDRSARLFIYYAGHGYSETIFEYNEVRGYITGTDTPYIDGSMPAYDAARLKSISMPQLSSPLQEILARHVLFLFDSCFAGTIFSTRAAIDFAQPLTPDVVARLMEKPARDFITAGGKDQRVPARSPIPALFLEALNGAADHYRHGVISATEIQLYLQDRVLQMRDLNLTPQQGRLPHVAFAEGKFLFRVANRYVLPPQPAPSPVPTSTRSSQLTKDDIKKLFVPFEKAVARVGSDYIERPDDIRLLLAAIDGMKIAFPSAQAASFTAKSAAVDSNRASGGGGAVDLSALHDMALQILNNGWRPTMRG